MSRKKIRFVLLSAAFALAIPAVLFLKQNADYRKAIQINRAVASENVKLGQPFQGDISNIVDITLLEEDARMGNRQAADFLALYRMRTLAARSLILGMPTPKELTLTLDTSLLEKDAQAGNTQAAMQLFLLRQREQLITNVLLGSDFPDDFMPEFDLELLQSDAAAGNEQLRQPLALLQNRIKAQALCSLGKPFQLDFFDKVDRELLHTDAQAGHDGMKAILKLAENRIKAEELTVVGQPYPEDFFKHVDKELLIADANAGNTDMQFIWGRVCVNLLSPPDPESAFKYQSLAAAKKSARAQCTLGYLYEHGQGVSRDFVKAAELYRLSALQGYVVAQYNYGGMLLKGKGVTKDFKEGDMWLRKAADRGYPTAMENLGRFIGLGMLGYKPDLKEGASWLKKAIDLGHISAIRDYTFMVNKIYPAEEKFRINLEAFRMGAEAGDPYCMAWYGRMLVRSGKHEEGMAWIEKCASAGHEDGLSAMADILRNGGGGQKRDIQEAVRLHEILAEKGELISMNNLGSIYFAGKGEVKRDPVKSAKYYKMFIENGGKNAGVLINLGVLYRDGNGMERDIDEAIRWFEKAAEAGMAQGHQALGYIYESEEYGLQDVAKMIHHFKKAGEAGMGTCYNHLGKLYEMGEILPQNDTNAVLYYLLAAEKNDPWALHNLAVLNEFGKCGVKPNRNQAIDLYKKAAGLGNESAKTALLRLGVTPAKE